jgi:hypothetical protein
MTEIHEPVQIASTFRQRRMQPVLMLWRNRRYQLSEITSYHVTRVGTDQIHHYAAMADRSLFYLVFNLSTFDWWLDAVELESA